MIGEQTNLFSHQLLHKSDFPMLRSLLLLSAGIFLGAAGIVAAQHHAEGESVNLVSSIDIAEKLNQQESKATFVVVTLQPGQAGSPHRHPGPVLGYVLEGEYELGIDDAPAKIFKAGETFYEPQGCLHRVSRNPAKEGKTRVLAVVIHPANAKDLVRPEHAEK